MLLEIFLPCLFFGLTKTLSPIVGYIHTIPVKTIGMGLLNPVASSKEKYPSSQWGNAELVQAMMRGGAFSNADHLLVIGEERRDGQKDPDDVNETKPKGLV